jgi:hypothetical protein
MKNWKTNAVLELARIVIGLSREFPDGFCQLGFVVPKTRHEFGKVHVVWNGTRDPSVKYVISEPIPRFAKTDVLEKWIEKTIWDHINDVFPWGASDSRYEVEFNPDLMVDVTK